MLIVMHEWDFSAISARWLLLPPYEAAHSCHGSVGDFFLSAAYTSSVSSVASPSSSRSAAVYASSCAAWSLLSTRSSWRTFRYRVYSALRHILRPCSSAFQNFWNLCCWIWRLLPVTVLFLWCPLVTKSLPPSACILQYAVCFFVGALIGVMTVIFPASPYTLCSCSLCLSLCLWLQQQVALSPSPPVAPFLTH